MAKRVSNKTSGKGKHLSALSQSICAARVFARVVSHVFRDCQVQSNSLLGVVPTALSSKFAASSFNLNCLSNYTTQPWCPLPFLQLLALTDLYSATNGSGWSVKTNWLTGDPCVNAWFGVMCDAPTNASITYVPLASVVLP